MYVAVLVGIVFAATLHPQSSAKSSPPASPDSSRPGDIRRSTYSPGKTALDSTTATCVPLLPEKPEKRILTSRRPVCFTVEVRPGEAAQLLVDQPDDLAIRMTSGVVERKVDSFDVGVETATLSTAGKYRVEVRQVGPSRSELAVSIVRWKLETEKAVAWQQAEMSATISKHTKKVEDIKHSLALWEELGDSSSIARTYLKLGSALAGNDPAAARPPFERALELCRANFDTRCSAEAENNSGFMSSRLGDLNEARQRLEEAGQDWRRLGDLLNEGATLSNLGLLLWQSGDFEQAIKDLEQAVRLLRSRNTVRYAQALNNLGLCYQSLAEYERARGYFDKAVRDFMRGKSLPNAVRARMNLGRNYMLQGNLRRAQPVLERAVAEAERLSDLQARADTLRNLAQNLWREGKSDEARSRLELALEADRIDGDRRGQSSALHYLGLIARDKGAIETARNLLTAAARLRQDVGLRDDAADSLFALADLEYHAEHPDAAREAAEQALKLIESVRSQVPSAALRASYYSRKRQFFDLLVDLATAPGGPNAAVNGLLAAEQGQARGFLDTLAAGSLLEKGPQDLAARHVSNQRQLDYLSALLAQTRPEKEGDLRIRFQNLVSEDEKLEDQIQQSVAGRQLAQPLDSVEKLQRDYLPPDSALLEFHQGARQSRLWLVAPNKIQMFQLPPAAAIEGEAAPVIYGFGQILERRRSPQKQVAFTRAVRKLSATLLGQLAGIDLPRQLILVPDGVLRRVPLAALWLPKSRNRLGLAHDLIHAPSAAYLAIGKRPRPIGEFPQTILAIADPVFSLNDPRAAGTYRKPQRVDPGHDLSRLFFNEEIKTMESLVTRQRYRVLRGFDASRGQLVRSRLEDFAVLHFSTHAQIDERIPELSWIALSMFDRAGRPVDGFLHPYQLAQFHLEGSIVVLSACDTALGKHIPGEGLVGLSSSLLYAGSAQLVVTLSEIDAEASSRFLSDVYRRFLPGENNMEQSITLARRAMASSARFSDPYYWASFVVIGQPSHAVNRGFTATYNRR